METGLVASENREGRDGGIDEASDCENYEEIVTEFVVPSEEVESLEADEGGHEVPEGDRESIERGLQPLERENKALEESQEHVDTVEDAIDTEGSARKRCHPCVHCTEIFMHRLRFSSTIVMCGNIITEKVFNVTHLKLSRSPPTQVEPSATHQVKAQNCRSIKRQREQLCSPRSPPVFSVSENLQVPHSPDQS